MARLVGSLWQDLRFAFRNLNKDRRFTVLAVLALSLGIGSVNGNLFRCLRRPHRHFPLRAFRPHGQLLQQRAGPLLGP